jgi:hypothetical protein
MIVGVLDRPHTQSALALLGPDRQVERKKPLGRRTCTHRRQRTSININQHQQLEPEKLNYQPLHQVGPGDSAYPISSAILAAPSNNQ